MREWIYIILNRAMPSMVKIGHCEEPPEVLVKSLDLTGASPFAYRLEYKVFLKDYLHILQNIRKALWSRLTNVGGCWYSISKEEAIEIIRTEIALFIIDKLRIEIKGGYGNNDFNTLMTVLNSILVLKENSYPDSGVVIFEAREIAKIIARIMKNGNWLKGQWLNRITGGSNRYASTN